MNNSLSLISLVIPGILALTSCAAHFKHKPERDQIQYILFGNICSVIASLSLAVSTIAAGPGGQDVGGAVRFDNLSAILLPVICLMSYIITRYNSKYLQGDAHRVALMSRMALLTAIATLLVLSNSIVAFALCWFSISVVLNKCVRYRSDASSASTSVFRYHVASDVFMFMASISLVALGGADTFSSLSSALREVGHGHTSGVSLTDLVGIALVFAFAIKSALFPFHRWLLSTLAAPTTLSALLHAGVVNVSAVAAARFSPVFEHSQVAGILWIVLSLLSAIIGTLSMSAQFDVKRKLVYSTVGQMGFMSLQCALGMVPLAVFHLIAHSAFKSHLFLQAGSTIEESLYKRKWSNESSATSGVSAGTVTLSCIFLAVACCSLLSSDMSSWTTAIASITAAAYLVTSAAGVPRGVATILAITAAPIIAALILCRTWLEQLLSFATATVVSSSPQTMILVIFGLLLVGLLPIAGKNSALMRALYVHGLNGFYTDKVVDRLVKLISSGRPKVKLEGV